MEIDPRVMKTILQMQWAETVPSSIDAADKSSTNSLFDSLLQQLLDANTGMSKDRSYLPANLAGYLASPPQAFHATQTDFLPALVNFTPAAAQTITDITGDSAAYESLIMEAAAKYNVDPSLIKAVIHTESSFRADAESSSGAKGLMQLMDGTAQGLGVSDSFDPRQNIDGGTRYLSYLIRKYDGNENVALAAYNAGPGRVDRLGIRTENDLVNKRDQLPRETQGYIGKVADALRLYV